VYWLDGRGTLDDGGTTAVYSTRVHGEDDDARVDGATPVDPRVCDCCQTDAATTADGPLVAYRDREDGEIRDISIVQGVPGEAHELAGRIVHRDGWEMPGCPVNGPALAATEEQSAVAWFSGAEGGAVYVAFRAGGDDFGPRFTVDAAQPPGRVDVTLLEGGAAVSWLARRDASSDSEADGVVRVRFVSDQGVLAPAVSVGDTGTGSAAGFPVMEGVGEHLYVGYRDENALLRVKRMRVDELPRGAAPARDDNVAPLELGARLPASAELLDASGQRVPLEALVAVASADEPLVLAFFARWCQPCREELAALEALRVAHPNWTIIAVSIDEGSGARVEAVARDWGFQGSVLRDAGAASALRVPPLPGTFAWTDAGLVFVSAGEVFQSTLLEAALTE
ncbi:MAG: thiol-disulfide isomerase/thioredoxin, partial [Polyangiales bacterium]